MNRSFLIKLLSYILSLVITSIGGMYFFLQDENPLYWASFLVLTTGLGYGIFSLIQKQLKQITFHLEAIVNQDFSVVHKQNVSEEISTQLQRIVDTFHQLKTAQKRQEEFFDLLLQQIDIGVFSYNQKGHIIHANPYFKKLFGLEQLTHIKQLYKANSQWENHLQAVENYGKFQATISSVNGKDEYVMKSSSLQFANDSLTLVSVQNLQQQLDEQELDSWHKLIRVLTHEIMNSITPITSLSETTLDFFQKDGEALKANQLEDSTIETAVKALSIIKEEGHSLMHFISVYRSLSRLPKPNKKVVSLKKLVESSLLLISSQNINTAISIEIPSTLSLSMDEELMKQVFTNLLKNAFEATENTPSPKISICAFQDNNKTEISFSNNGTIIPMEEMKHIFVPFFTTKTNGDGIGLSLSRQIVRLHGGQLRAFSDKELTEFKISL